VVETLAAALRKTMASGTVRERFRTMGVEVMEMPRAEFAAYVRTDYEKWLKLAREAHIVIE
jgi:tripartite-type tricarboxylate transporter receptor subunit TctC